MYFLTKMCAYELKWCYLSDKGFLIGCWDFRAYWLWKCIQSNIKTYINQDGLFLQDRAAFNYKRTRGLLLKKQLQLGSDQSRNFLIKLSQCLRLTTKVELQRELRSYTMRNNDWLGGGTAGHWEKFEPLAFVLPSPVNVGTDFKLLGHWKTVLECRSN